MNKSEIMEIRKDFLYLDENKVGKKVIYLDGAATSQRPIQVIEAVSNYYNYKNANPHRGAHYLSVESTDIYEKSRERVRKFINADNSCEIIFTRSTTESINLVAYSYGLNFLKPGDEILITILEHHSNLCTWQYVAQKTGAKLNYIYLDDDKQLSEDDINTKLTDKVKLLAVTGASNTVGTCPDIKKLIVKAKEKGAVTLIDAAQFAPHNKIDVKELDCDFLAFSGHKMCADYGIGVLYGKKDILNNMPPYNYGGDMVEYVYEQETTYAELPYKFEAGTQNVGGAVSLATAIDYIENIGIHNIKKYENELTNYAYDRIKECKFIDVYNTSNQNRSPILLFNFKQIHPHDVSSIMDSYGVAIRSGHHCAAPLHHYLGLNASCRASFSFYNTIEEVDTFIESLYKVGEVFKIGY